MRIALLALADLGKRVPKLLRFKNGDSRAVTMAYIFIENRLFFLLARVEEIVGFKLLLSFRQTEIARQGEPDFFDNLVNELLTHAHLVIESPQSKRALFVKLFAVSPNRFSFGIRRPPRISLKASLEVMIGK